MYAASSSSRSQDVNFDLFNTLKQNVAKRARGTSTSSELGRYLGTDWISGINPEEFENFDSLAWWKQKESQFSISFAMARDLLSVQASTVASKSAFSLSGRVLSIRRTRLTPASLEMCICLKDHLDAMERVQHHTLLEAELEVFVGHDELVESAIARGLENIYVLVRSRSKTNASRAVIKVWLKCDRGGVYKGEPKLRHTSSNKTGCEFELIGKYERSCGGWKLRVVNSEHNHQGAERLGDHPYAMRLNEAETRLVEQLSNQNILPVTYLQLLRTKTPIMFLTLDLFTMHDESYVLDKTRGKL
ncbi:hypothetical protein E3N88_10019 [Mikania micrantha]|uniref:HAT C-terminal dimerisation domain-containing protein n=1 Tax=Mikania micrantha TaxID=192012 RepID=A0A5N6PAI9_9ASTR|nr:hypothetical protein E3N88_10019 [Mikania micrantha]